MRGLIQALIGELQKPAPRPKKLGTISIKWSLDEEGLIRIKVGSTQLAIELTQSGPNSGIIHVYDS